MIMDKMCITDSWLKVSYQFIIYIYITSIITEWIRTIIARIRDQTIYRTKGKSLKTILNKRKGWTQYYFKTHKRQGISELKQRFKPTNVIAFNTIVYKTSINKSINTDHWDQESYPMTIDSCCSVSIAKNKEDFIGELQKCNVTIQGFKGSAKIKF